jgi:flagellar biosynthesis protein FlhG
METTELIGNWPENSSESKATAWNQSVHRNQHYKKQIWAVGGGKGGVGKSLVSSSLAYSLAKQGLNTIIIDLDLGGANLHTVLGQAPPEKCVSDVLNGKVQHLSECVTDTHFTHLKLIGGAKDDLNITQLTSEKRQALLKQINELDAQFIILDLGAGTSHYTLEFFNLAQVGIVTVLPEPTSIENAYRFLKAVYYQRILADMRFQPIIPLVEAAMTPNNRLGIRSPTDLMNEVNFQNPPLAAELKKAIRQFKPKVILNQTRSQTDVDVGFSMKSVAKKYFGIEMDYLGYLEYEPNVWQSVRRMRPILAEHPHSRIAVHIERMCNYLLKQARIDQTLNE